MATTIITFKAITSDRRIVYRNIPIEHEFEIIPSKIWNGIELPQTSVEEQVMNQLDETDKSQIMIDNDFYLILDYWSNKPRKKKVNEIAEFMNYCEPLFAENPTLKRPFEAIISEHKDSLFGKRKSNKTKLNEIFNIYNMIMKAARGTIRMIENVIEKHDNKYLD